MSKAGLDESLHNNGVTWGKVVRVVINLFYLDDFAFPELEDSFIAQSFGKHRGILFGNARYHDIGFDLLLVVSHLFAHKNFHNPFLAFAWSFDNPSLEGISVCSPRERLGFDDLIHSSAFRPACFGKKCLHPYLSIIYISCNFSLSYKHTLLFISDLIKGHCSCTMLLYISTISD